MFIKETKYLFNIYDTKIKIPKIPNIYNKKIKIPIIKKIQNFRGGGIFFFSFYFKKLIMF